MAFRNILIGTLAALAGIAGVGAAALTANRGVDQGKSVQTIAQPVETRTVVIRRVEHRIRHLKPKRPRSVPAVAPAPAAPAPVVRQAAPVPVVRATTLPVVQTARPVRTRTSATGGHGGEHESGTENKGEHNDD